MKFDDNVKLADPENPVWCKNLGYISYTSGVIANFVLKNDQLVTLALKVGLGQI